jgi:hypothetical protein
MYKTGILEDYKTSIEKNENIYKVYYEKNDYKGTCEYRELNLNGNKKPISQRCLLLTHCEMGDIIEDIHNNQKLSSEDFHDVSMDIRNHSYDRVMDFLLKKNNT